MVFSWTTYILLVQCVYASCEGNTTDCKAPTTLGTNKEVVSMVQHFAAKVGAKARSDIVKKKGGETTPLELWKLPRVLYLGTPHSGSTTFMGMLNMHPDLSFGNMKEHDILWRLSADLQAETKKYISQYSKVTNRSLLTIDGDPHYLFIGNAGDRFITKRNAFGAGIEGVKAVRSMLGDNLRFIVMLRNPIDWMISQSIQEGTTGGRNITIDEMLDLSSPLANQSCYVNSLETWMQVYPAESFFFTDTAEFTANEQEVMDKVHKFLGVSPYQYDLEPDHASGRRRCSVHMSVADRHRFWEQDWTRECVKRLANLTHYPYDWHD